jgi:hypothetical protein
MMLVTQTLSSLTWGAVTHGRSGNLQQTKTENDGQGDLFRAGEPQLGDWVYGQGEDGHITEDVDDGIGHPLRLEIDALGVLDGFVPERGDWVTLEYGDQGVGEAPADDKDDASKADSADVGLDEDAQVQAQERDLADAKDKFVHHLGCKEPLRGLDGSVAGEFWEHTLRAIT